MSWARACAPTALATSLPERDGVLITRPPPGAEDTAARVAALGLRPILAPLLDIAPLAVRLPPPADVQAILIASGHAIPSLPLALHSVPVLAVGDATAARARAAGFLHVRSAGADAVALAALAADVADPHGRPLLLAAGRGQSQKLAADLRGRGFRVLRRAVYASSPARRLPDAALAALASPLLRAVLFFSAETAHAFVRLLVRARLRDSVREVDACAIGAPAAAAIEVLPWRHVMCAARPTQDAMLALLS